MTLPRGRPVEHSDVAALTERFRIFLLKNAIALPDNDFREGYLLDRRAARISFQAYAKEMTLLNFCDFVDVIPYDENTEAIFLYPNKEKFKHTVSKTHFRLPRLELLLALSPQDFFLFFRLINTAITNAPNHNIMVLDFAAVNLSELKGTALDAFFTPLPTNFRFDNTKTELKWTPRTVIPVLAGLEPSERNQLSAIQYLAALKAPSTAFLPIDAAVNLELDVIQLNDQYCVLPEP